MSGERVAVMGAAGQTGLAILRALRAQGVAPLGITRDPGQADAVLAAGAAKTTTAAYTSIDELIAAFSGADRVVIVPPSFTPEHVYVANAAAAATAAGVKHVLLHSVLHPHTPTMRHHMRKAAAEASLRDQEVPWTILQPAMYAQTPLLMSKMSPPGRIFVPWDLDKRFTVIDLPDIAEITAKILQSEDHYYATYELVGSPPASSRELMRVVAEIRGLDIEPEVVHPWELDLPEWIQDTMADFAAMCEEYTRHGLLGNATVARMLLDREPTHFAEAARRELAP